MRGMVYPAGGLVMPSNRRKQQDHPVIGTVGRISNNIDVALLLELADHFPDIFHCQYRHSVKGRHALRTKKNIVLLPPMLQERIAC